MNTTTMTDEKLEESSKDVLFLFDVDGTLTPSRQAAPKEILRMLSELRKRVMVGFVGGSDLAKQREQIGDNVLELFSYCFPENGTLFYKEGKLISSESIISHIGEEAYAEVASIVLRELSETPSPIRRSNFLELRSSMINASPIGRSCTIEERQVFLEEDKKKNIKENLSRRLGEKLGKYGLVCSVGGQISVDIFPEGWDKTFCLKHIDPRIKVYFFGDKTMKGGNDYEIARHPRVIGITVTGPDDTLKKVDVELLKLNMKPINK